MQKAKPTSTRVLEHVAYFEIQVPTKEGIAYAFLAVDDYSQYAFMLIDRALNNRITLQVKRSFNAMMRR